MYSGYKGNMGIKRVETLRSYLNTYIFKNSLYSLSPLKLLFQQLPQLFGGKVGSKAAFLA